MAEKKLLLPEPLAPTVCGVCVRCVARACVMQRTHDVDLGAEILGRRLVLVRLETLDGYLLGVGLD